MKYVKTLFPFTITSFIVYTIFSLFYLPESLNLTFNKNNTGSFLSFLDGRSFSFSNLLMLLIGACPLIYNYIAYRYKYKHGGKRNQKVKRRRENNIFAVTILLTVAAVWTFMYIAVGAVSDSELYAGSLTAIHSIISFTLLVIYLVVSLYMGAIKNTSLYGIRNKYTQASRKLWKRAHHAIGKCFWAAACIDGLGLAFFVFRGEALFCTVTCIVSLVISFSVMYPVTWLAYITAAEEDRTDKPSSRATSDNTVDIRVENNGTAEKKFIPKTNLDHDGKPDPVHAVIITHHEHDD